MPKRIADLRRKVKLGLLIPLLAIAVVSRAGEPPAQKNRFDLTGAFFDGEGIDHTTGYLAYTRNVSRQLNFNARIALRESLIDGNSSTGIGDTSATLSYLPNFELSIGPWFPRIVGSGLSVLLPTGDENNGLGLGGTVLTPFIGTVVPLGEKFTLAPSASYSHSFEKVVTGEQVRVALVELGLGLVTDNGLWFRFYPGYVKDFVSDKTSFGTRSAIGYVFDERWGLTFNYIDIDFFRPGLVPEESGQFERTYEITVHYGF